jgi:hypothetical protein
MGWFDIFLVACFPFAAWVWWRELIRPLCRDMVRRRHELHRTESESDLVADDPAEFRVVGTCGDDERATEWMESCRTAWETYCRWQDEGLPVRMEMRADRLSEPAVIWWSDSKPVSLGDPLDYFDGWTNA